MNERGEEVTGGSGEDERCTGDSVTLHLVTLPQSPPFNWHLTAARISSFIGPHKGEHTRFQAQASMKK